MGLRDLLIIIVQLECTSLVFEERENQSTYRKTSCNKEDNQQIIMALMPGIEPGPHQWQPSALTTASFLLPCTILTYSTAPSLLPNSIPAPQHHPRSPAPSPLPSSILAPQVHPCSTVPSLLHSSISGPQLHPCSTAPSYLFCSILAPLHHHCLPSYHLLASLCTLLAPLGHHVWKQFKITESLRPVYGSSVILHNFE